jgi:hypothetical protein
VIYEGKTSCGNCCRAAFQFLIGIVHAFFVADESQALVSGISIQKIRSATAATAASERNAAW